MTKRSKLPHWPPRSLDARQWVKPWAMNKCILALLTIAAISALVFFHIDYYRIGHALARLRAGQPVPCDIIAAVEVRVGGDTADQPMSAASPESRVPEYRYDADASRHSRNDLNEIFTLLRAPSLTAADRARLQNLRIPPEKVPTYRRLPLDTLDELQRRAQAILDDLFDVNIVEGAGERQAQETVQTIARERFPAQAELLTIAVSAALHPNWLMARGEADPANGAASRGVVYRAGEYIMRKGDIATHDDLQQLMKLRIITPLPIIILPFIIVLVALGVALVGAYLRTYCRPVYASDRRLTLMALLILATLWSVMTLGGDYPQLVGLIAVPAGAMAIAGLLGTPAAIPTAVLLSILAGISVDHPFTDAVLMLGSSIAGVVAVSSIWPASRIVPAVVALMVVNLLLLFSTTGLRHDVLSAAALAQVGDLALWAAMGALGATLLAVGGIYVLARPFGITTHYRLMELATDPNEPLLRRMVEEAPGSYHSSVMVANMAEAAADAIGANVLLTRVAALYHDIGKLKRPAFFVENQAPLGIDNVHQRLSPKLSYLILASHVRDGVELGRQHQLPEEIIGMIREHHGTTLATYFYHRALQQSTGDEKISEHDFRYPGPKPSTRESAIVMLADSVQASVKALKEPTPTRIEGMVRDIINSRLDDGQFEDCDITLRDIKRIATVFTRILTGLNTYTRIEYPEIKGEGTRPRVSIDSEPTASSSESTPVASGG